MATDCPFVLSAGQLRDGRFILEPILASAAPDQPSALAKLPATAALRGRSHTERRAACLVAAQLCLALSMNGRSGKLVVRRLTGSQATRRWTDSSWVAQRLARWLSRRELRWDRGDAEALARLAIAGADREAWLVPAALSVVQTVGDHAGLDRDLLLALRGVVARASTLPLVEAERGMAALAALAGAVPDPSGAVALLLEAGRWGWTAQRAAADLKDLTGLDQLLQHLVSSGQGPGDDWWRRCAGRLVAMPAGPGVVTALVGLVHPRPPGPVFSGIDRNVVRGAAFALGVCGGPDVVELLAVAGGYAGLPTSRVRARNVEVALACVEGLRRIGTIEALAVLGRLSRQTRHASIRLAIDRGLAASGYRSRGAVEDLIEETVPAFGLDRTGRLEVALDGTTVLLAVQESRVVLRCSGPTGRFTARVPAAVRRTHGQEIDGLRAQARAASDVLADERRRLEDLLGTGRSWPYRHWRRYYLDHPLTGQWVRRLVWEHKADRRPWRAALHVDGFWQDASGRKVARPAPSDAIRLWHPIRATPTAVEAWRRRLTDLELRQPFPQAWREIYRITTAERATWPISERVTGQVLRYPQARALMIRRGWNPPYLLLHWEFPSRDAHARRDLGNGWTATFTYHALDLDEINRPTFCTAGPVRFERAGKPATAVPALAFSEAMRDIGLLVGVAGVTGDRVALEQAGADLVPMMDQLAESFGWGEPSWLRHDALAQLLPGTTIAERCTIEDPWLVVRGNRATYRIHLRSAAVFVEPDYRFIYIASSPRTPDPIFLPFEEHGGLLSEIVSKAFLLADDEYITDTEILKQLPPFGNP